MSATPSHTFAMTPGSAAEEQAEPRQRVLDAAEALFMRRGYTAIALRDIAEALGIKQASLYYHFPQGKEELYVAVAERAFARHAAGIEAAMAGEADLAGQLRAVAAWFAGQPRMCLMGMIHADLPALAADHQQSVEYAAYLGVFRPLSSAFAAAQARGETRDLNPNLLAGTFLALLDGAAIGREMERTPAAGPVADEMIDIFLNGVRPRA